MWLLDLTFFVVRNYEDILRAVCRNFAKEGRTWGILKRGGGGGGAQLQAASGEHWKTMLKISLVILRGGGVLGLQHTVPSFHLWYTPLHVCRKVHRQLRQLAIKPIDNGHVRMLTCVLYAGI